MVDPINLFGVEFFTEAILNISVSVSLGILLTILVIKMLRFLGAVIVVYMEESI